MIEVIIIRGAPGVGKSSVGRLLAEYFNDGVSIEVDNVRAMINSVTWSDRQEHINAILAAKSLLRSYYNCGYKPIVVIDSLSGGVVNFIVDELPTETYIIFSLYANNEVLKERIINRESGFKDYKVSFWVNDLIINSNDENNVFIDTSDLSSQDVIEIILSSI